MEIASVMSDRDDSVFYLVSTKGASKREGGTGIRWECTCPHCAIRKRQCKHIKRVKLHIKGEKQDSVFLR